MEFVRLVLVFLHLLGMAVLIGSFLVQRRIGLQRPLHSGWHHGAGLQLLTGLALIGVNEAQDNDLSHAKMAVKLVVLLVIFGLVFAVRRRDTLPNWLAPAAVGLVVVNVGVAVFWT